MRVWCMKIENKARYGMVAAYKAASTNKLKEDKYLLTIREAGTYFGLGEIYAESCGAVIMRLCDMANDIIIIG